MTNPFPDEPSPQPGELLRRVQARQADALAQLYDLTVSRVFALARAMLGSREDAEELVIDVYERAWNEADRYDPARGSPLAWLLVMCRSRALDQLRQRASRRRGQTALAVEPRDEQVQPPDDDVVAAERDRILQCALEKLPAVRRELITLAFFEDLSQQEIAARLRMPLGTVKSHVRRGITELRNALGTQEHSVEN